MCIRDRAFARDTTVFSSGGIKVTTGGGQSTVTQTVTGLITGQKYILNAHLYTPSGNPGTDVATISLVNGGYNSDNASSTTADDSIQLRTVTFTASSTSQIIHLSVVRADYGTFAPSGSIGYFDIISVTLAEGSNKGSNFTPQVGDDRQVTFEGVTKINSDAYFCLPTGNTESREATGCYSAGTRGVMMGCIIAGGSTKNATIDYWTMASTGDAIDFGDCTGDSGTAAGVASRVRGVNAGAFTRTTANFDYVTIMSTGNALDFGDLPFTHNVSSDSGFSSETRG